MQQIHSGTSKAFHRGKIVISMEHALQLSKAKSTKYDKTTVHMKRTKQRRYKIGGGEQAVQLSPVVVSHDEEHLFFQVSLLITFGICVRRVVRRLKSKALPVVDLLKQFQQRPANDRRPTHSTLRSCPINVTRNGNWISSAWEFVTCTSYDFRSSCYSAGP